MPAFTLNLQGDYRIEIGSTYTRQIVSYVAPPDEAIMGVVLLVPSTGVYNLLIYVPASEAGSSLQSFPLSADSAYYLVDVDNHSNGNTYIIGDVLYMTNTAEDWTGTWTIKAKATYEDLSQYTSAKCQIRKKADSTSTVILEFLSSNGSIILDLVNGSVTLKKDILDTITHGTNLVYDIKLTGAALHIRRFCEGLVDIVPAVTYG